LITLQAIHYKRSRSRNQRSRSQRISSRYVISQERIGWSTSNLVEIIGVQSAMWCMFEII